MRSKSRIAKLQQLLYDMAVLVFHSDMDILLFHQQHKPTGETYSHPPGGAQLRGLHPNVPWDFYLWRYYAYEAQKMDDLLSSGG